MGSAYVPRRKTTGLTPADEAASSKAALDNLERQGFHEWPNEAGVSTSLRFQVPRPDRVAEPSSSFDGLTEQRGPIELKAEGNILAWCKFDKLAHTHKFDIVVEGPIVHVYYSSRRQSDEVAADIKAAGTLRSISFAQRLDPCVGLFGKFMSVFEKRSDIHNVGVTIGVNLPSFKSPPTKPDVGVDGHRAANLVIATDAAVLCEMDPSTMEPISFPNHSRFHPDLKGSLGSAHAMADPDTGDYINYNLDFGKQPVYRVLSVSASTGRTDILATIPYKAIYEGNLRDSFKPFDGVVTELASPACFFFHTVNAFEDDDSDVFCELVQFPNRYILDGLYYDVILDRNGKASEFWTDSQLVQKCFPRLVRCRLRKRDFATSAASAAGPPAPELVIRISSPHAGDLPVINPKYRCKKHRYTYMVVSRILSTMLDAIVKIDIGTRELLQWEGPKGHTPGEAIFVPRPAANGEALEEDDGVLLSVVLDGANRTSYLLCLDAKTMTDLGRAECEFGVAIGLHGCHVPAAGMS
ncbi:hypothetical protein N656DRAFT_822023 [Canariomyces notabilis]|uniref:Carotenoid cleavage dioxygenase 1 n=1 Tax=Canariomyces notabilis TaxID=2074819 RepID=A0AAN6QGK5_9PEZI|nr:hypothetical protein N656DRAFT_822023 [Canariomyces arenarius]